MRRRRLRMTFSSPWHFGAVFADTLWWPDGAALQADCPEDFALHQQRQAQGEERQYASCGMGCSRVADHI